ncbi:MAG: aldose epimerase family protein [Rikenellaceae bacterium]
MADIKIYTLKGGNVEMVVTNFGARVMKLFVADRDGKMADIVLGYNTIEEYLDNKGERFLGAVCGRFANRIAKGQFTIDGVEYNVPINNNGQSLHGGLKGIDSVVWDVVNATDSRIDFRYVAADGEEGYPGELTIDMSYELTDNNEYVIEYKATTTKKTHVNLTHHSFFNLRGEGNGTVNEHTMMINAEQFIPIDNVSIPTGDIDDVEGTPFDFRVAKVIGQDLGVKFTQLDMGAGYDHCWVLVGDQGEMKLAAVTADPESGRRMSVYTDQKGIQFYGGNFFDGKTVSKDGKGAYDYRGALALETQLFPDTPNQPHFPSTILDEGEVYTHTCIYKFDTI